MEDNTLDFNFWPSFSDLMLTLVLILVIVVFSVIVSFSVKPELVPPDPPGTHDLTKVEEKQKAMIKAIADEYGVEWENVKKTKDEETSTNSFVIPIQLDDGKYTEILITNDTTLQRYSFSDRILFRRNKYDLNEEGKGTLRVVGREIINNLEDIKEIQIQGHADPDRPANDYFFNLNLASKRAIEVYKFLQRDIRIDPAKYLMSATSFGEYKPVQRLNDDSTYDRQKLSQHNRTRVLKEKNRRIEILLFYRLEQEN